MSIHDQYTTPQAVLDDKSLKHEDKVRVLTEWADHEKQKLIADEENMAQGVAEETAHKLPAIINALNSLGVQWGESDHARAK
ncbi:MAG: hypothetical protein COV52_02905 [Gammaproteobacteria bacterium CG11_big_fil_rev_8_21_14_0_20_46_22]|nr:MAG: hypothetical protein COW05_02155 [Gammaproteobacteria bacterium CG12_big_fil_rev_8_21_14_0_65_46_12]PIR11724.1 MAG: hypothetical protein COV52_02905 [Gammaproteobacteria bacterium CG11_big_fil_rev_8_21_14_0_20_46_22]